jgi:biotin carboxyl carrier protein
MSFFLNIDCDGSNGVHVDIEGRRYELKVFDVEPGIKLLLLNDHVYECRILKEGSSNSVHIGEYTYITRTLDPRRLQREQSKSSHGSGRVVVAAPMPGKVIKMLVEVGNSVKVGDGIAVVEAMKMQNEMKAPKAGTIVEARAMAGSTVKAGDVLAVIEG